MNNLTRISATSLLRSGRRMAVVALCAACATQAWTQANNLPPTLTPNAADQKWAELQSLLAPPAPGGQSRAQNPEAAALARRQQADRFLRAADKAKAFGEDNAAHPQAREAHRIEAKSLLQAAMAGDASREARARELVGEVRRDQNLPAKSRLELVALAEAVRIRPLAKNRTEFLAAHEQSARSLIVEFPTEAGGYEALLRLAESHPDDAEGIRIAREIATMPAPESVKVASRTLLERQALVGQSLPDIARTALGEDNVISLARGRGIILYAWATISPGSMAAGKNLAKTAPAGLLVIGLNLDENVSAAQGRAQSEGLPGEQIYDPRGFESPLAQALKITRPGEVYVASAQGTLRSVSASRGDLAAKLGAAVR